MAQNHSYPVAWIDLAREDVQVRYVENDILAKFVGARVWLRIFFTATYRPRSIPSDLEICPNAVGQDCLQHPANVPVRRIRAQSERRGCGSIGSYGTATEGG